MFTDYINDIIECAKDYYENVSKNDDTFTISEYVCDILKIIVDKKKHKYIYPELIEQYISRNIFELNKNYNFDIDDTTQKKLKNTVQLLKDNPQAPQRSEEWYSIRKTSIGASEISSVFNKNPFTSRTDLLLKKLDYKDPEKKDSVGAHCIHGIKYEEIANMCYNKFYNTKINEFGSIKDKNISCIAASPDGITDEGVMVEIKCPLTREIYGVPSINYWHQMQQQLYVCELIKCDFFECKIIEYSWSDFKKDKLNDNNKQEIGLIIEFVNTSDDADVYNQYGWVYAPLDLSLEDYIDWINIEKEKINNDNNKQFSRIIPWKLLHYSLCEIFKNNSWWDIYGVEIIKFWDELSILKINGFENIIPKKKEKKIKPTKMKFIDDP